MCTFTVAFSLIIGFFVMLPDDLENLGQSAVATNLFSNNILQSITTGNYWDVTNEHKPLLHTWSLAVEEQYYLFIPILASLFFRTRKAFAVVLTVLSVFSLVLFYSPVPEHIRFYQLPCRFFEIAIGGIAKLCFGERSLSTHFLPIGIAALIAIVFSPVALPGPIVTIPLTVALAAFVLVAQPGNSKFARKVLENRISILVGLTSYSLYMWHQPLIAFYRYTVSPEINAISGIALLSLTLILSIASYHVIEKPFRSPNTIPTWLLFLVLIPAISSTTAFGYYLNSRGGIVRDVPELDIRITDATKGVHSRYNHKIRELNQGFTEVSQLERVLIVGNSFARDWANILLESSEAQSIEIQYVEHPMSDPTFLSKFQRADIVFFSTASRRDIANMGVSTEDPRIYVIGTKNFGTTAGIFYNYRGDNYISQTTEIDDEHWEVDAKLRSDWGSQFVDLLSEVKADGERVHVITPEGKLISQDCRHLTKAGATFFARRLESRIRSILHPKRESDSNNE